MAFKKKSSKKSSKKPVSPTRVYAYYAKPPDRRDEALVAIRKAHTYYNKLVEIDRERWGSRTALVDVHVEDLLHAEKDLAQRHKAKNAEIKADRSKRRSRKTDPVLAEQLKSLEQGHREARKLLNKRRKELRLVMKDELSEIDAEADSKVRAARNICDVYWGTYLLREKAIQQAKKDCMNPVKCAKARKPLGPPKFKSYTGEGDVGVQLQGGLSVEDLFGFKDTRLRMRMTSPKFAEVWMRTGSEGRAPIWTIMSIRLHRPLPEGGIIKWARLFRTVTANKEKWSFQFTVSDPTVQVPVRIDKTKVGIDLGWRLKKDGSLRIAYLSDHVEVVLPTDIKKKFEHAEEIRSLRDKEFNLAIEKLQNVKTSLPNDPRSGLDLRSGEELPSLRRWASTSSQWRRKGKLVRLIRAWESEAPECEPHTLSFLQEWAKQDLHLWQWEAFERKKASRQRREFYRLKADQICQQYATIKLENLDVSDLARLPTNGAKDSVLPQIARRNRVMAGVSKFTDALMMMAAKHGTSIQKVKVQNTTRECSHCGYVNRWKDQSELVLICGGCGVSWDQDQNAADVIVARTPVVFLPPGAARSKLTPEQGRWAKRSQPDPPHEAV